MARAEYWVVLTDFSIQCSDVLKIKSCKCAVPVGLSSAFKVLTVTLDFNLPCAYSPDVRTRNLRAKFAGDADKSPLPVSQSLFEQSLCLRQETVADVSHEFCIVDHPLLSTVHCSKAAAVIQGLLRLVVSRMSINVDGVEGATDVGYLASWGRTTATAVAAVAATVDNGVQ